MILRVWRGHTSQANAAAYVRHVTENVFPALGKIDGYRGAYLLQRETDKRVEFQVQTLWDSMKSIGAFAGEQAERAVVEPEARALLTEFDEFVKHYELVHQSVIR